jgi:hypothetical protein
MTMPVEPHRLALAAITEAIAKVPSRASGEAPDAYPSSGMPAMVTDRPRGRKRALA